LSDTLKTKLAELARAHGQRGMRLLALFETIKPLVKKQLDIMRTTVDDDDLNQACLEKADELLLREENVNPEHIFELVQAIRTKSLKRYRTPNRAAANE
jgi:hypothetical protein